MRSNSALTGPIKIALTGPQVWLHRGMRTLLSVQAPALCSSFRRQARLQQR